MIQTSSRNQLHNCHNGFQGDAKKVLCVCSAGLLRSPTCAVTLHKEYGYNTRSAGIGDYALIPVSQVLLEWADEIVVMEESHAHMLFLSTKYQFGNKMEERIKSITKVLNIPDDFSYNDPELVKLILERYNLGNLTLNEYKEEIT